MATTICPNCKMDSFTWSIDEEKSPLTRWGCYECGYIAFEDETSERKCSDCHQPTESKMADNLKKYWWCRRCHRITNESE